MPQLSPPPNPTPHRLSHPICLPQLDRHLEWYARNLGFNGLVSKYDANPDPLKNFREWRGPHVQSLAKPFLVVFLRASLFIERVHATY
jgi:hypothetical protein